MIVQYPSLDAESVTSKTHWSFNTFIFIPGDTKFMFGARVARACLRARAYALSALQFVDRYVVRVSEEDDEKKFRPLNVQYVEVFKCF